MSEEPDQSTAEAAPEGNGGSREPSEEELRAAYEAELHRITSIEVMLQAAVSLLNIGALRLGPPPGGADGGPSAAGRGGSDLEQARDAIDGVRALIGVLERRQAGELGPMREALSQLQLAYARAVQAQPGQERADAVQTGAPNPSAGGQSAPERPGEKDEADAKGDSDPPGPAEASGRLWVPGR